MGGRILDNCKTTGGYPKRSSCFPPSHEEQLLVENSEYETNAPLGLRKSLVKRIVIHFLWLSPDCRRLSEGPPPFSTARQQRGTRGNTTFNQTVGKGREASLEAEFHGQCHRALTGPKGGGEAARSS